MAGPKSNNTVIKTVSLPDEFWTLVDKKSTEWQTNRSATLRRIILEWQDTQTPSTNKKSQPAMIAA